MNAPGISKHFRHLLVNERRRCCTLWGCPGLYVESVSISSRLVVALGSCTPVNATIRFHKSLFGVNRPLLSEVFCHELAHIAAYAINGHSVNPHGQEWRDLVSIAGFSPRVQLTSNLHSADISKTRKSLIRYKHTCLVCHSSRYSPKPQLRWRCSTCVEDGLQGRLQIESYSIQETNRT